MRKLLLMAASMLVATAVSANINPIYTGTVDNGDGTFSFNYNIEIGSTDAVVTSGDYLTLYDVGSVDYAFALPGWTASTSATGPSPIVNVPTFDDPTLGNLTLTYNGSGALTPGVFVNALTLTANSADAVTGAFAAESSYGSGPFAGDKQLNSGFVQIPLGGSGNPQGVPEPMTWGMMLVGFGFVGMAARRRGLRVVNG